jgi:ATP-dependent RNA helicase SUPV3L1/SUV3
MHIATRQSSSCVLCAFRTQVWESLTVAASRSKRPYRVRSVAHRPLLSISRSQVDGTDARRLRIAVCMYPVTVAIPNSSTGTGPTKNTWGRKCSMYELFNFCQTTKPLQAQSQKGVSSRRLFGREDLQYTLVTKLILEQYAVLRQNYAQPSAKEETRSWGIKNKKEYNKWVAAFQLELTKCCAGAVAAKTAERVPKLFNKLRQAFVESGVKGLTATLKYRFATFVMNHGFSKTDIENQMKIVDLRYPLEWFPKARAMQRKIHLHVGPTNSGKTYQALKRLETAKSGVYAGPLRLLAHEVYTRLNAKGRLCSLITGEERRVPDGQDSLLTSCTVEMVPLSTVVDVAVIDEIQMIADIDRGWAWTQALLGIRAKEVHLCGEARTIPLIQDLCAAMGDSLEIHNYDRLSPLEVMKTSLKGDLTKLEKGDAVILFSRLGIHAMKKEIEQRTGKRCAVVYGSLPPETRAQQANLFNDPNSDYDILVASDAVGMGLNLSIKRVIFEATSKHDGSSFRTMETSELKQIAGRAGRYRTAAQAITNSLAPGNTNSLANSTSQPDEKEKKVLKSVGLVTTMEDFDMPILEKAMRTDAPPLEWAGIAAPAEILVRFAAYFPPNTPFSYILVRFADISTLHPRFQLCRFKDQLEIADAIQPFDLTVSDRIIFVSAPAALRDEGMEAAVRALAKCVAEQSGGHLLDIKEINLELLDEKPDAGAKEYLRKIESLHKILTLYLWLSYRFAGVFNSQRLAFHVKALAEEKIDKCLAEVQFDPTLREKTQFLRKRTALQGMRSQAASEVDGAEGHTVQGTPVALPSDWEEDRKTDILLNIPSTREGHEASTHG